MKSNIHKENKIFLRPLLITFILLLIPILGSMFVQGWNWGPLDFITMVVLIFGTGLLVEFANKKIKNRNYKFAAIGGIIIVLIAIWVEFATDGVSRWLGIMFT